MVMTPLDNALWPVKGKPAAYVAAALLFLVALGVRHVADPYLPPGFPYLTFFPAVILATFLGGRGPGAVCALLSGLAAWYFYIAPRNSLALSGPVITALLFYAFVVSVDIWLIHSLQMRQSRLEESERQLAAMAQHQSLLFKELQHRVANNLSSVASMLRLQRRRIEQDPAMASVLIDRADERIELLGRIHRQLYDPATTELPVAIQVERAVEQAREVVGSNEVVVAVNVDIDKSIHLEIGRLMPLVLLVIELVTNSFKHGFPDGTGSEGSPARVSVSLKRAGGTELLLTVSDNGQGYDPAHSISPGQRSLGTAIIRGFVVQLGGTMETRSANGVSTTVQFRER